MIQIGWIDYSKEHRDRVMSVLDMLATPGAMDELGISVIRDAFADRLFPGLSTLLTRAKYYLIVPWIMRELGRENLPAAQFAARLHQEEIAMIRVLLDAGEKRDVIGERARETLKRKPSDVYWNGLRTFGIFRDSHMSLANYLAAAHRVNRANQARKASLLRDESDARDDCDAFAAETIQPFWDAPEPPDQWRTQMRFLLSFEEARFLRDKILSSPHSKSSLLAHIISQHPADARDCATFDDLNELDMPADIRADYDLGSTDSRQRAANLAKYLSKVQDFENASDDKSIAAFVEYQDYLLESGADEEEAEIDDSRDAVQLMTVHAAKGLEWPCVFVVSMSSARFPTSRRSEAIPFPEELVREVAPQGDFHLQEERRLAYVALTRAQRRLYLSCVEKKGKKPSVFVQEVSADGVSELLVPEVTFDPAVESASKLAIVDRDIRRRVIRVMDESADVEAIQPYVELLAATRQLGADPNMAEQILARLEGQIDPALHQSVQDMLERQLIAASVAASTPPEPLYMSYSRLSAYEDCPLGYKFSYELRIPARSKPYFAFGNTVHLSLNKFLEDVRAGKEPSLDDLKSTYHASWVNEGYVIPSQEAGYRREGESSLESFYRRYRLEKVVPLHLEWRFTLPVGGHFITGFVDRIDPLTDGTCSILDYKTGKPRTQKEVDADLQLTIYALAVQECLGLKAEKLSLYFLRTDEMVSTTRTDEQLAAVKDHVLSIADSICARKFEPVPEAFKCGRCDYAGICPVMES